MSDPVPPNPAVPSVSPPPQQPSLPPSQQSDDKEKSPTPSSPKPQPMSESDSYRVPPLPPGNPMTESNAYRVPPQAGEAPRPASSARYPALMAPAPVGTTAQQHGAPAPTYRPGHAATATGAGSVQGAMSADLNKPPLNIRAVWPAAVAALLALIGACIALDIAHFPIIPFVGLAVVCISHWNQIWARTLWHMTLVIYALWLIVETTNIWLPFFIGLVVAYIVSPIVTYFEKIMIRLPILYRWPRLAAVILSFVLFAVTTAFVLKSLVPQVSGPVQGLIQKARQFDGGSEVSELAKLITGNLASVAKSLGFGDDETKSFSEQAIGPTNSMVKEIVRQFEVSGDITNWLGSALPALGAVGGIMLSILLTIVTAGYLLIDFQLFTGKLLSYFSYERGESLSSLISDMARILRKYLQGHSLVCIIVGAIYFIVLIMFKHPYSSLLATIMTVLMFIPFLGHMMAFAISIMLTLAVDPAVLGDVTTGHLMIGVCVAYAACWGANEIVLYPVIAGRSVELNPVIVLLVVFVFHHYLGILGMFLAVPLAAMVRTLVRWVDKERLPGFDWVKVFRPYNLRETYILRPSRPDNPSPRVYPPAAPNSPAE